MVHQVEGTLQNTKFFTAKDEQGRFLTNSASKKLLVAAAQGGLIDSGKDGA